MCKAMQVEESRATQHVLDRGASVFRTQHPRKPDFSFGSRREVSVASFRRQHPKASVETREIGFTQPCSGCHDRGVALRIRGAGLQRVEFVGPEQGNSRGHGFEIIQKRYSLYAELP